MVNRLKWYLEYNNLLYLGCATKLKFRGPRKGPDFKAGRCQSSLCGQRVVYPAEVDTRSCGPWINLVMCVWSGSVAWLHTPALNNAQ